MRLICLIVYLMVTLSTGAAVAQEAYVYDQLLDSSVYVYDASSTGKLTPVKGSPFQPVGQMIGTNGKFFLTADSTIVYSYAIESNGGIGKYVSQIDTLAYSGSKCGQGVSGAALDHTGSYVYILVTGGQTSCSAYQTFEVDKTGFLSFKGAVDLGDFNANGTPVITGNEKYAISDGSNTDNYQTFKTLTRESSGSLVRGGEGITFPAAQDGWLVLSNFSPDPNDHLAVVMQDGEGYYPPLLASFSVNSRGAFSSTNTIADMPRLSFTNGPNTPHILLDPSGKYLAVAIGTGVQLYHFNGSAPMTIFGGLKGVSGFVYKMSWDGDLHLYALNGASLKMHVYKVANTGLEELPGSGTVLPPEQGSLVVRTK